jgi:pimeloyl-ACP methyl ester carboxylesterase
VFDFFPEEDKELRRGFRHAVEKTFPQEAAKIAKSFGLTYWGEESADSPKVNPSAPSVVLIHGLDDPGKVWMNLAPVLTGKDTNVWQLRYPNDQPIVDSARFFYDQLKRLKQLGISEIAIVAHSMGGLVSREMLTNPQMAYTEKTSTGDVPRVTGLIMVGTPNHGSELARFRVFGEIREQWVNMVKGRGHILRGILDGAGEAKIDLIPNSQFLKSLNKRPHPEGVRMLIIAGDISPWDGRDIDRFLESTRKYTPTAGQKMLVEIAAFLKSMSGGLGDGLVTVKSTRLDGTDHQTVHGTHLSMIRNISKESSRIPPAVPLIIEYLGQMSS